MEKQIRGLSVTVPEILYREMAESLALVPENANAALLIRHSIRYPIPPGDFGNDIPLTPEGILLAEEWGRKLDRHVGRIFSSPVGRCVETGRAVLRGIGQNERTVHTDTALSEAFIRDENAAGPVFMKHGPIRVINRLLRNIPIPGMVPVEQGVRRVMTFMFANLSDTPCLNLHITHDGILAPVLCHLMGRDATDEESWPRMLEGAFFWYEEPELFLSWRGTRWNISRELFQRIRNKQFAEGDQGDEQNDFIRNNQTV
ncbi:histidine phosphatase family protein [Desulfobacterales bacterium HSG2]|nr:histidine phosphatase family protein [Desulfobacterales bacterium HSG2]